MLYVCFFTMLVANFVPLAFRELLLGHNYLRTLPYEVGKLFNIIILVLVGNPLTKEIMALYSEPNGTQKLLTYMLDNLHGKYILLLYINLDL